MNYLDNNLTGDERITHLKDRMRECQKVFSNLKSALGKIEKQRRGFLRKQKPILTPTSSKIFSSFLSIHYLSFFFLVIQTTPTEILGTSSCT